MRAKNFFFEVWTKLGIAWKNIYARLFQYMKQQILDELVIVGKGIISAMIAGAALGALQYIGAHIGDCTQFVGTILGGIVGVKVGTK